MKIGDKVGIVARSNGQDLRNKDKKDEMAQILNHIGLKPVFGDYIYDKGFGFGGTGKERANALMRFYQDEEIKAIFDISVEILRMRFYLI